MRRATTWRREENQARHLLEMTDPAVEDHDTEIPDHDKTPIRRPLPEGEAPWLSLQRLRELAITFIPLRMSKRFARVFSSKLNELASLMRKGDDTQEREMLNVLV